MSDTEPTHVTIVPEGLSEHALSIALFSKFTLLAVYGTWAAIVEIPSFVGVGGSLFATIWGSVVAVTSAFAGVGVVVSWTTGKRHLEHIATALFIVTFLVYSWVLIARSVDEHEWDSVPLALIPVVVCILPTVRFYDLLLRPSLTRARSKNG